MHYAMPAGGVNARAGSLPGLPGPALNMGEAIPDPMRVPLLSSTVHDASMEEPPTLHRTFFPETWLWDLHVVGETGQLKVPVTIPHTITEWIGNGYCIGAESGLGISAPFSIKAFQPFFVSFTLPYSMIRGEQVAVPVSVFNYLSECLQVSLVVEESDDFSIINDTYTVNLKVCGHETEVFTFNLVPREIGKINFTVKASSVAAKARNSNSIYTEEQTNARDIVTRELLVEAEGKPEEITKGTFVCGSGGGEWKFSMPSDVVSGSERAQINVIGDVMGPALSGLDNLLAMPTGCGEQNMLLFAPNIYVLQYLSNTKRLTPAIEEKALGFMQTGYQRELNYRHDDGSYSAFGKSDSSGSIWLTAFVIKSFAQAKPYMFIDDKDLQVSVDWMKAAQLENGCFPQIGTIHHKEMTGGIQGSSKASLTAYILVSLIEAGLDANDKVIRNAVRCLDAESVDDVYTLSLMAYAYSVLPSGSPQKPAVMAKLEQKAINEDGMKHWETKQAERKPNEYHHASPANVEATAYVLLALLHNADLSIVSSAMPIVRWLSTQRNANGGFSSTQDTVLALQSLAQYAGLVHGDNVNLHVEMAANGVNFDFRVTKENSLLLQKHEGLAPHSVVHYSATGVGCALIQASLKFNRLNLADDTPSFALTVDVSEKDSKKKCNEKTINICARYNGSDEVSNMAVIAIKMVSGWIPEKSSVEKLKNMARINLKRFDIENNAVQLYFDEFDKVSDKCFSIKVEQDQQVEDAKPAFVHIYDYYSPSSAAYAEYSIESTCIARKERSTGRKQLSNAKESGRSGKDKNKNKNKDKNRDNKKKPKNSNCPVCEGSPDAEFMRKFCESSYVSKVSVGTQNSMKMLSTIRSKSNRAKLAPDNANMKYKLSNKCLCPSLIQGAEVLIATPKRFHKKKETWIVKLRKQASIVPFTPETRCP
jgi:hypothetical protein